MQNIKAKVEKYVVINKNNDIKNPLTFKINCLFMKI